MSFYFFYIVQCIHKQMWKRLATEASHCHTHFELVEKGVCSTRLNCFKPCLYLSLNLSNFLSFHLPIKSFCLAAEKTGMFSNQQCWHFKCKYHGNVLSVNDVRKNNRIFSKPLLNCHKLSTILFSGAANWHGKEASFAPLQLQSPTPLKILVQPWS